MSHKIVPHITLCAMFFLLAASAAIALAGVMVGTADLPSAAQSTVPIGVNLEGLADWMSAPMFVNAMKTARAFGTVAKPWEKTTGVDADGNPTGDAGVVVFTGQKHVGGIYHFSCQGRATVGTTASHASIKSQNFDMTTDRTSADIFVADDADQLMLTLTNTTSGVRDLRLIRPGYPADTSQVFTREFLAVLRPFSTLRFMDYSATNGNSAAHWSDRAQVRDAEYTTGKGGPWEDAILLANLTGKDLWINIPDQADDDYVRHLAQLFKKTLNPRSKIYLEYSNEVWNWSFPQATHNQSAAEKEVAADPASNLRVVTDTQYDDSNNKYYWGTKRIARRLMEIRAIWASVYGPRLFAVQIRPILAGQIVYDFLLNLQMGWIAKEYGPPKQYVYAVAGAPYFNLDDQSLHNPYLTTDAALAAFQTSIDKWGNKDLLPYARIAQRYGVKDFAYEGGPDMGQTEQSVDSKIAANRDPRMKGLIVRYLTDWYTDGGDLFMYFSLSGNDSKWGAWGLLEDITKPTPKTAGLAEVMRMPRPLAKKS